ncbi:AAA family ATPase [Halothiobacillus sp. DCM-1]|uniref:AAA family ATPase n=1 Tax=Halothiobacillus sp. DCM-1 TaxID=3112558 RepID=UPI00324BDC7B
MRLTKLYLAGFKSFATPTEIPIPDRRVAIVGPNGCGKSNLIDAIRWVLGESSARQLRGQALDDVIFAGAGQRPAASQAVVELSFDNSDRRLNGPFGAYDELVIRRSLGRDGQSQYRINGTRVRRRDVIDLFLGTGVGARSYSVIEQGQVNRIVDAKPEDLRAYLEETAGISVYRERRRETHQRLTQAEENLARLTDLVGELDRQQSSLERQAKAAERYRSLQHSRRRLIIEQTAVALALAEHITTQAESRAQATAEQAEAAQQAREAARQSLRAIEPIRQQAEARQQQLTAAHFGQLTERSALQGKIGALRARLDAIEQQQRDQHRLEQLHAETAQQEHRLIELQAERQRLTEARDQAANERAEHSAALRASEQALASERERLHHAMQQAAEARSCLAATRARLDALAPQLDRAQQRLNQPAPDFEATQRTLDAAQAQLQAEQARLDAEHTALTEALAEAKTAQAQAQTALAAAEQAARQAQAQHSTQEAERQALERLLRPHKPTPAAENRLIERLADAEADPFWAHALGAMTQAECVPDLDALYAHWQNGHRRPEAGWWITPAEEGSDDPLRPWLADWQKTRHRAPGWDEALHRRHQLEPGHCFVLDDGWHIGRHWLGRASNDSAAVTLAQHTRLRALNHACTESAEAWAEAQATQRAAQHAFAAAQTRSQQLQQALQQNEQARIRLDFTRKDHQREQAQLAAAQASHAAAHRQLGEDHSRLSHQQAELAAARGEEEAVLAEAERLRQQRQAQIQQAETALIERRHAASEAQQRLQTLERTLDRTTHQHDELLRSHARHAAERTQIQQRQQEAFAQTAHGQAEIDTHTADLARIDQRIAELDQALAAIQAEISAHHAAQQTAQQALYDAERTHEQAQATHQQAALALHEARIHQQHAADALAEAIANGQDDGPLPTREHIAALAADPETVTRQAEARARLDAEIQRLGAVNLTAIEAFAETRARKAALDEQMADVRSAIDQLRQAIGVLDQETRQQFTAIFHAVNERLAPRFQELFGGGQAQLALTDSDALDAGVQLFARPPGKKVTHLSLLSGGERALTAVALIFALFEQNPAPFCILDEVDAPLDEANVGRFCDMVSVMSDRVQFLFITHNKTTMASAQALIGVTMREAGVSRVVSVDVERAVALLDAASSPH